MPPYQLTLPLIPFTIDDGFFQRCVKLEYINKALLYDTTLPALQRVSLEFQVDSEGAMGLKRAFGEKKRSIIDILGVSRQVTNVYSLWDYYKNNMYNISNVDIRLLARELDNYSSEKLPTELEEMTNQCKLTG